MKEAQFWTIKNKQIQCQLCNHYCLIKEGQSGLCAVRKNIKDKLYSLVYGKVIAENIDPIEKKPLFHFCPGSLSYSIATVGCNFICKNCQNADISQYPINSEIKDPTLIPGNDIEPEEIIYKAKDSNCASISYTYTEPTIYAEYALACMKLAHKQDLKNVWVSNGYTASEAWLVLLPYLDAINIDLKFFNNNTYWQICGAKLQPVLDNLKMLKKYGLWIEVTTLIIPGLNDSDEELIKIAKFINNDLGSETPWHVSRFFPQYKLNTKSVTAEQLIYKAYKIGKDAGLKYVYGGNTVSGIYENTYCSACKKLLIKRTSYKIESFYKNGKCCYCSTPITIIK